MINLFLVAYFQFIFQTYYMYVVMAFLFQYININTGNKDDFFSIAELFRHIILPFIYLMLII